MHSTAADTMCETCSWVKDKPGQLTERWNTPLTPAYKYINKTVCDPDRHTVGQWCGLEGLIDDMLEAGVDAASGQLSPGVWMNECHITDEFPEGITDQGWTQPSLRQFLDYLDQRGVGCALIAGIWVAFFQRSQQ